MLDSFPTGFFQKVFELASAQEERNRLHEELLIQFKANPIIQVQLPLFEGGLQATCPHTHTLMIFLVLFLDKESPEKA